MTTATVARILYTDKTAAVALSCSERQIRVYRELGWLESFKTGRSRYYTHEALVACAARLQGGAP